MQKNLISRIFGFGAAVTDIAKRTNCNPRNIYVESVNPFSFSSLFYYQIGRTRNKSLRIWCTLTNNLGNDFILGLAAIKYVNILHDLQRNIKFIMAFSCYHSHDSTEILIINFIYTKFKD